jgi:hypothetical protein
MPGMTAPAGQRRNIVSPRERTLHESENAAVCAGIVRQKPSTSKDRACHQDIVVVAWRYTAPGPPPQP